MTVFLLIFSESEQRSQFEHPGLLTSPNPLPISVMHLAINNSSVNEGNLSSPTSQQMSSMHIPMNSNTSSQCKFQNSQTRILEEIPIQTMTPLAEDYNIIDNKGMFY